METSVAHSNSTKLNDRVLWYDGDSTVSNDHIIDKVSSGIPVRGLFVEEISDKIKQYNKYVSSADKILIKTDIVSNTIEWTLPDEYKNLDITEYLIELISSESDKYDSTDERESRSQRAVEELVIYKRLGLLDVLRLLVYIIDTFRSKNVVWGTGRGSSVSSYLLYLIGVHDVDSHYYDLDIGEFLLG